MRLRTKYNPRYPSAPGLVLDAQMFEGSGSVVHDLSGNGNTGTIYNGTWVASEHGGCLSFNGTTSYVNCGNGSSLDITKAITIESIVKKTDISGIEAVVRKDGAYLLRFFGDVIHAYFASDGWKYAKSLTTVSAGEYYHVVTTYDSGDGSRKPHIYLMGDEVLYTDQQVLPGLIATNTNDLCIGSFNGGDELFSGLIVLVRVYNRALSASEIKRRYEQTKRDYIRG